jgi:hypothetical protein
MKATCCAGIVVACMLATAAWAQSSSDRRSLEYMLKKGPPQADDARLVNANIPELVQIRVSQLEEDLNLSAAQMPQWNAYRSRVQNMVDDIKRGVRVSASESSAPKRLDALADEARNRLTAVEDIVDAAKALYAVLTPEQKAIADRRLALPLATLTGNDAGGGEARVRAPPPSK